jgi:hypothetical protein
VAIIGGMPNPLPSESPVCCTCGLAHADLAVTDVTNSGDLWLECRPCRFHGRFARNPYAGIAALITQAIVRGPCRLSGKAAA